MIDMEVLERMMDDLSELKKMMMTYNKNNNNNTDTKNENENENENENDNNKESKSVERDESDGELIGMKSVDIEELLKAFDDESLENNDNDIGNENDGNIFTSQRSLEIVFEEQKSRGLFIIFNNMRSFLKRCVDSPLANNSSTCADLWKIMTDFYVTIGDEEISSNDNDNNNDKAIDNSTIARDCLMKQLRALAGQQWKNNTTIFEEFARASLRLATFTKLQLENDTATTNSNKRALASCRMHLRGVVKQAADDYGDSELYNQLCHSLDEIVHLESELRSNNSLM